jgi:hypothetical protein
MTRNGQEPNGANASDRLSSRHRRDAAGVLELVDETVAPEVDVDAVHDAVARLLLSRYRRTEVNGAPLC